MNAVNLIPADARSRRVSVSTSPPTLAVIGGLVLVLVAAVVYVSAANKVTARRSQLARVSAAATAWNAAAARYSLSVQEVTKRSQQLSNIRQLAAGRYPWSELLTQLGGLMPADAALNSLQATTGNSASPSGTSSSTTGSSTATGSSSSPSTSPIPTVQLSGCAASQPAVADTMVRLHEITGVTSVTLSSSTSGGAAGSGGSTPAASSSAGGGCAFPVQFQISLTFGASPSTGSAGTAASTGSTGTGTTGSAAAPVTASATSTTGAAQ